MKWQNMSKAFLLTTFVACAFILWLIYLLTPILSPFVVAITLAYLIDPFVEWLSSGKAKIPRAAAVMAVFLLVFSIIVVILIFIIPAIQHQIEFLLEQLPTILLWYQNKMLPWLNDLGVSAQMLQGAALKEQALKYTKEATKVAQWLWQSLFHSGEMLFHLMMNSLIVLVVGFYLLRDWKLIIQNTKTFVPPSVAPIVFKLIKKCDEVLSTFLRGQLIVMLSLGTLYSVGLGLVGVHYSLLLGMIAGILSIVPYLGSIVGVGLALFVAYIQFSTWHPMIGVCAVFGVGHVLELMVLTPLLIGDKLGLHPVVVIFAVLAGGHLMGFVGVMIALPFSAMLVVAYREWSHHLQQQSLNQQGKLV